MEPVEFEILTSTYECSLDNTRLRKFCFLLDSVGLDWDAKFVLIDLFPKVEKYFNESGNRTNFINLSQLAYYLCKMCGFGDQCFRFKQLKTNARRVQIMRYLEDALGKFRMTRFSDDYLIKLGDDSEIVCDKIKSGHVYHD